MKKNLTLWLLVGILAIGALLRLTNLTGPDIIGDDATYSFRSVGYVDWIASLDTQTTPVVWFATPQWWQRLSFHDAPPLVFAVQWLFFQAFGVNTLAARLPFVLAGLFSIWGIFLLGRKIFNEKVGLLAAGLLAIMNYDVWISRIGFLDGFVVLWVTFSLYFFLKAKEKPIYYLSWWVFCALGLLSKYTFLFLGPVFLVLLLTSHRSAWRTKWFWLGAIMFLALLSPVIIYNVMVFKTRGHFDAALSTLVGMHPKDYEILTRQVRTNPLGILGALQTIWYEMSLGLRLVFLLCAGFIAYRSARDPLWRRRAAFIGLGLLFALAMLVAVGGGERFAVITLPFVTLVLAAGVWEIWNFAAKRWQKRVLIIGGIVLLLWEGVYAIQTQLIPEPIVKNPLVYYPHRPIWTGYRDLESYITDFYRRFPEPNYVVFANTPQIKAYRVKVAQSFYDQSAEPHPQQKHLLVYDDRIEWFASVWTVERRRLYENQAIATITDLRAAVSGKYIYKFREFGFEDAYVITVTDKVQHDENIANREPVRAFVSNLEKTQTPVQEIKNAVGEVVFKVFRIPFAGYE